MSKCKKDCDFNALLASGYTNDIETFIKNVVKSFSPQVGATCGKTLSKYINIGPVTANSIISTLSKYKKINICLINI